MNATKSPPKPAHGTCKLVLLINDTAYDVRPLVPHPEAASVAWRLRKGDGTEYHVHVDRHGAHCQCGDAIYRRQNSHEPCKHVKAMRAVGLLETSK